MVAARFLVFRIFFFLQRFFFFGDACPYNYVLNLSLLKNGLFSDS